MFLPNAFLGLVEYRENVGTVIRWPRAGPTIDLSHVTQALGYHFYLKTMGNDTASI